MRGEEEDMLVLCMRPASLYRTVLRIAHRQITPLEVSVDIFLVADK